MFPNRKAQRGFLVPLALFIIVVMAGFAITIARTSSQSNTSVIQSVVGVQAFYAADTGAQWGLNQLFYQGAPLTRASVDAACNGLTGASLNLAADGLRNCTAQLQCSVSTDPANTTSYYQVTSSSSCGNAPVFSERTVQVSAMMR